ncbi:MAG: PIG-L family deacetylase [Clostridia bacterium]|nr:PIG-L family deacetylase [Clostridia bacterium]
MQIASLLLALLLFGSTCLAEAAEITRQCAFWVSEGKKGNLTDDSFRSSWTYAGSDARLGIELPDSVAGGTLQIGWDFEPSAYQVEEYNAERNLLRTRDSAFSFPCIETCVDLLPETKYVFLQMTAPDQAIAELRVFGPGELPENVHVWNPPVEKAELMVVSTHQDDELIFFGGTIPYYTVAQNRPTVVVYMANCGRSRRQEALNGLWAMGVRNYPQFINLKDKRVKSIEEGLKLWGGQDHVLEELAACIRCYRPEVIVTHDLDGEYGHNQHKITARLMQQAIDAAADASRFPESAAAYGTWQVKKLYIHLYGENQVNMPWKVPLEELGGRTPLEVARLGYAEHASQQKYFQVEDGGKYDNSIFGLYFTTVGLDSGANDMFENIPTPTPEITPTPSPTPTPVITPTPVPTAEPTAQIVLPVLTAGPTAAPTAETVPAAEQSAPGGMGLLLAMLGGAVALGIAVLALDKRARKRRRRHKRRK